MNNRIIFIIFMLAFAIAIAYIYITAPVKPDKGINFTPKDYIEKIESDRTRS